MEVIICETCRHADGEREKDGETGGAALLRALRAPAEALGCRVTSMKCLMACDRHCTLHVRAPGKMAYTLGDMTPAREHVDALLAYLEAYERTPDGRVPFREWPEGVKGHFIARTPPMD